MSRRHCHDLPQHAVGGWVRLSLVAALSWTAGSCGEQGVGVESDVEAADVGDDAPCTGPLCVPCPDCKCREDLDCVGQEDGDRCNGTLRCDRSAMPWRCIVDPATVVTCKDASACQVAVCAPATGECGQKPAAKDLQCDDGNPCTTTACDGAGKCAATANKCDCEDDGGCAKHEDGDACNGTLVCDTTNEVHKCVVDPATVVNCPDAEACFSMACDPATGTCASKALADQSPCDDGKACTLGDRCLGGACVALSLSCGCTSDAACANFEDGDACNGTLFCNKVSGACVVNPATKVNCPTAGNTACRTRQCVAESGACAWTFSPDGAPCDDGNPCSKTSSCVGGACAAGANSCGCKTHEDCAAQEDGDLCNGQLFCDTTKHECRVNPATVVSCPDHPNAPCSAWECQPKTGKCAVVIPDAATACDDGQPCTLGDVCKQGACTSGPTLVCPCAVDSDCGKFEDGDLCNGTLRCDTSGKVPACVLNLASVVTCTDDGLACTESTCDPTLGKCVSVPVADGTACQDGDPCTGPDTCKKAGCSGKKLNCDDGDACSTDTCSAAAGGVRARGDPVQRRQPMHARWVRQGRLRAPGPRRGLQRQRRLHRQRHVQGRQVRR